MSATSVFSRRSRLDVVLDGVRISRSASDAARRGSERVLVVEWDQVSGARLEKTSKGRPVVRLTVLGAPVVDDHREDPYAVKADAAQAEDAAAVVELINAEAATRRRWREVADASRTDLVG